MMSAPNPSTLAAAAPQAGPDHQTSSWVNRVVRVIATWNAAWWVLLGALVAPALPGHWLTLVLAAITLVGVPLLVLGRAFAGAYPSASIRLFVFRPFWYLQLAVPLMATAGVLAFIVGAPFGAARRAGQIAPMIVGGAIAASALVGYAGSRRLRTMIFEARLTGLPRGLDGLRIAQVSDLHVGPHTSRAYLRRVLQAVEDAAPEVIAITGDQVDDYAPDIEYFARAFSTLSAPLGVFAIPGNHDVYAGWPQVREGLDRMGVTVLVNESRPLTRGGERFWIAGTGDPAGTGRSRGAGGEAGPDITRTLSRIPAGAFTIALAHNPALWPQLAERGVRLTLSGHTHYGQFSIPALGWSLASAFLDLAMGAYRSGRSLLYISPGTNYWGLPLRIGALPEVTVITLRPATAGEEDSVSVAPNR